jgi:hypothetical protein
MHCVKSLCGGGGGVCVRGGEVGGGTLLLEVGCVRVWCQRDYG